jgi:hypothetical protein
VQLSLLIWFLILQFSNYNSIEGVLYCKPHYDQILKSTGSLDKSFEGTQYSQRYSDDLLLVLNTQIALTASCLGLQFM